MKYISTAALGDALENLKERKIVSYMELVSEINAIPAADVVPVVRSRWREREDLYYGWNVWECMNCHEEFILEEGTPVDNEYKFCPNCGARMEGSE